MHPEGRSPSLSQSPTNQHARHNPLRSRSMHGQGQGQGQGQAQAQGQSQLAPSLPSIHHLHPNLPPPHAHAHRHRDTPSQGQGQSQGQSLRSGSQPSPELLPSASYVHPPTPFFAGTHTQSSPAISPSYPHHHQYDERRMYDRPQLPPAQQQTQAQTQSHSQTQTQRQQHQMAQQPTPSSAYPEQRMSPPEADSDQDQNESERGPPKKKRRRQALSCTECKRRKIKCDRSHPCGPCARRSEPEKCQWHVIEPVDKYVTRSEWDELFGRYRILEERCLRLESLVVQMHPEVMGGIEQGYYEHPHSSVGMHSPTTASSARPGAARAYTLAGPGIAGAGVGSGTGMARARLGSPLTAHASALRGHGVGGASASTGAESSASTRSGSAPPPLVSVHSERERERDRGERERERDRGERDRGDRERERGERDRRTCASGSRASFAAAERPLSHQVPALAPLQGTAGGALARDRAPSSLNHGSSYGAREYAFPPPPLLPPHSHTHPLDANTSTNAPFGRRHSAYALGRTPGGRSSLSPAIAHVGARTPAPGPAIPYPSPRSAFVKDEFERERERGMYERRASAGSVGTSGFHYRRRHDEEMEMDAEEAENEMGKEAKNGEAQTSGTGDALRHSLPLTTDGNIEADTVLPPKGTGERSSASASSAKGSPSRHRITAPRSSSASSANALHALLNPDDVHPRSRSATPAPTLVPPPGPALVDGEGDYAPDVVTPPRKRARRGSLHLNIPSSGSAPGTPPPALVVH